MEETKQLPTREEVPVEKTWDIPEDATLPESITVQLKQNGTVITDEKFDDKKIYEYVSKNYNDCLDTFIQAIKDYYGTDYEGYKE